MEREEKGVLHKNNKLIRKNKVGQYFMCEREKKVKIICNLNICRDVLIKTSDRVH